VIGLRRAVLLAALIPWGCGGPSQTASPSASPQNAAGLLEWYQLEARERPDQDDVLGSLTLRTGYVDGTTTAQIGLPIDLEVDWPPLGFAFASGPAGGLVAYAMDDGTTSRVHLVDVATGETRRVLESTQAMVAGMIHPSADALYLLSGDRRSHEARLVRVDLDGAGVVGEPVELPGLASIDALSPFGLLHGTPDGSRLVLERCADSCAYRVISLAAPGERIHEPDGTGVIVGMGNTTLLAQASTWTSEIKRFFLVDLASGAATAVEPEAEQATLVEGPTGSLVVIERHGTISVLDPATGALRQLELGEDLPFLVRLVPEPERQGLPLPPGWIVLGDEGRIAIDGPTDHPPVMVEVATGRIVELRNLGPKP
jgi:hypothetical protein